MINKSMTQLYYIMKHWQRHVMHGRQKYKWYVKQFIDTYEWKAHKKWSKMHIHTLISEIRLIVGKTMTKPVSHWQIHVTLLQIFASAWFGPTSALWFDLISFSSNQFHLWCRPKITAYELWLQAAAHRGSFMQHNHSLWHVGTPAKRPGPSVLGLVLSCVGFLPDPILEGDRQRRAVCLALTKYSRDIHRACSLASRFILAGGGYSNAPAVCKNLS